MDVTSPASDYTSVLAQKAIQQITEPASLTGLTADVDPPPSPVNFVQEIQSMLFAFGDSRRPKLETAILVDDIVRQQLVEILCRAIDTSHLRGAEGVVGIEDVVFLLRKNPVKVQRFVKYFSVKDMAVLAQQQSQAPNKRSRRCRDFVLGLDAEGGLLHQALQEEIHDQVRMNRLRRLDRFSRNLDERKYAEFTRARQVSFLGHNVKFSAKFKEWVVTGVKANLVEDGGAGEPTTTTKVRMDQSGLEALAYLAYETVGQVVDVALLVRHDQDPCCRSDPVMRTIAPLAFNNQYPTVQMPQVNDPAFAAAAAAATAAKSSTNNGGKDEDHLFWTQPLEPHHIMEAVRRLTQMPSSFLGWYGRPELRNHTTSMPLIAI